MKAFKIISLCIALIWTAVLIFAVCSVVSKLSEEPEKNYRIINPKDELW